jgi:hypothetical protein
MLQDSAARQMRNLTKRRQVHLSFVRKGGLKGRRERRPGNPPRAGPGNNGAGTEDTGSGNPGADYKLITNVAIITTVKLLAVQMLGVQ